MSWEITYLSYLHNTLYFWNLKTRLKYPMSTRRAGRISSLGKASSWLTLLKPHCWFFAWWDLEVMLSRESCFGHCTSRLLLLTRWGLCWASPKCPHFPEVTTEPLPLAHRDTERQKHYCHCLADTKIHSWVKKHAPGHVTSKWDFRSRVRVSAYNSSPMHFFSHFLQLTKVILTVDFIFPNLLSINLSNSASLTNLPFADISLACLLLKALLHTNMLWIVR